ncbi:MAG: PRC-barrel domain-containing protein [Candidatus Goldbacteria bacterium]|nr:PRC-barrel domain-containing protein [Candidatus Goldiibacteriota bacterium]
MIRYQDVIGKPAISIQEGKNFGKVIDVFVNIQNLVVDGFVISDKDDRFLPYNQIKNIGDSIIFSSGTTLLPLSEKENINERKGASFLGLKVITENGKENGTVASFYFKIENGFISHFELQKNIFKENLIMSIDGILRVGEDAVIIYNEAAEIIDEMKKRNDIKIKIKKIGRSVQIFTKSVFNKKVLKDIMEKSERIMQKTKNSTAKIKDAVEKTINKIRKK